MTTTDLDEWIYMFTIVKGMRSADIFIRKGLEDKFRVVCLDDDDLKDAEESTTLDYCREVGENFVMGRNEMKKFKVIVLRSQYQTVIVDAEDHEHAETIAIEMFDPDLLLDQEFIEAYDVETLQKPKTWRTE